MTSMGDTLKAYGVDYDEALERFGGNAALYQRLAGKFVDDPHYAELEMAFANTDTEAALRAARSLKGVAGNLSFTALFDVASRMNVALRDDDLKAARALMPELTDAYNRVMEALAVLEG